LADLFLSKTLVLANTTKTVLYTAPANTISIVKSLRIHNAHTSAVLATVNFIDVDSDTAANTESTLFKMNISAVSAHTDTFPLGNPIELITHPLVANEGDIINVTAGTAAKIHVHLSVLEIT
tara:strand:- start:361 stop:726 length:366 start_codon:yes stop_codon:yes gene_type:complete